MLSQNQWVIFIAQWQAASSDRTFKAGVIGRRTAVASERTTSQGCLCLAEGLLMLSLAGTGSCALCSPHSMTYHELVKLNHKFCFRF